MITKKQAIKRMENKLVAKAPPHIKSELLTFIRATPQYRRLKVQIEIKFIMIRLGMALRWPWWKKRK